MSAYKKPIAFALSLVLAVALGISGTLAWLTATSGTVTNTFTVGDINITLTETETNVDADGNAMTNTFEFVPGDKIAKDPKVTVEPDSEACYLFVKVVDANNTVSGLTGDVISWSIRDGWTSLSGHDGYWYRMVNADTAKAGVSYYVLAGEGNGQVTVNENVTKDMVNGLKENKPVITISAAAVQSDNITDEVEGAWEKLPSAFTGATS